MTIKSKLMSAIGRPNGRRETDIEVVNVAIRAADRAVFLKIIRTREDQLAAPKKPSRKHAIAAAEVASFALAAKEAIATNCPPELVASHLETTAACAIDLLVRLQVND